MTKRKRKITYNLIKELLEAAGTTGDLGNQARIWLEIHKSWDIRGED